MQGEKIRPERLQEGANLMKKIPTPYMVEEALTELGSDRQEVHTRGDKS
jgi:hypothetical protein